MLGVGYLFCLDMLQIFQFVLRSGLTSIAHHELGEPSSEPRKQIIRENMIEIPEIMSRIDEMEDNYSVFRSMRTHEQQFKQVTLPNQNKYFFKQSWTV